MAHTELINTADEKVSDPFAVVNPTTVVVSGLASEEECIVKVEVLGGGYDTLIVDGNTPVKFDALNNVVLFQRNIPLEKDRKILLRDTPLNPRTHLGGTLHRLECSPQLEMVYILYLWE